jgi:hypothetical protein
VQDRSTFLFSDSLPDSGFTLLICNIATEDRFGHVGLSSHHSIESVSAKIFHYSDCSDLRCHRRVNDSSRDWRWLSRDGFV